MWTEARKEALTPAQCRSPLGRRPYDLRHAAVPLFVDSGRAAIGTSGNRSARYNPLHRLAGDLRDQLVISIVVQNGDTSSFSHRRNQQLPPTKPWVARAQRSLL